MLATSEALGHPAPERAPRGTRRRLFVILATVAVIATVATLLVLHGRNGSIQATVEVEPLAVEQNGRPGQGPGAGEEAAPASALHVMQVGAGVASVAFSADGKAALVGA